MQDRENDGVQMCKRESASLLSDKGQSGVKIHTIVLAITRKSILHH